MTAFGLGIPTTYPVQLGSYGPQSQLLPQVIQFLPQQLQQLQQIQAVQHQQLQQLLQIVPAQLQQLQQFVQFIPQQLYHLQQQLQQLASGAQGTGVSMGHLGQGLGTPFQLLSPIGAGFSGQPGQVM